MAKNALVKLSLAREEQLLQVAEKLGWEGSKFAKTKKFAAEIKLTPSQVSNCCNAKRKTNMGPAKVEAIQAFYKEHGLELDATVWANPDANSDTPKPRKVKAHAVKSSKRVTSVRKSNGVVPAVLISPRALPAAPPRAGATTITLDLAGHAVEVVNLSDARCIIDNSGSRTRITIQ